MKATPLFASLLLLNFVCFGQNIVQLNKNEVSAGDLDARINLLMKAAQVQGLAIAIFNNNEAVYKKTFGYKNAVKKEPLLASTNIYGASLSKPVFAVMVMKLVELGVLDLDKPLQSYLPKPIYEYTPSKKWHDNYADLKADSAYRKITARMCLDHSSGFPNWRWDEADQKLRVKTTPGSRYGYSGEGMVYLQVVLEYLLNKPLEQLMQETIFTPLQMNSSSYTWQAQFENDYCVGHTSNGETYEKDKDNDARAASTLETTFDDYVHFTTGVLKQTILNANSSKEMFSPQLKIKSVTQFGPLRLLDSTLNDGIELSYGLAGAC